MLPSGLTLLSLPGNVTSPCAARIPFAEYQRDRLFVCCSSHGSPHTRNEANLPRSKAHSTTAFCEYLGGHMTETSPMDAQPFVVKGDGPILLAATIRTFLPCSSTAVACGSKTFCSEFANIIYLITNQSCLCLASKPLCHLPNPTTSKTFARGPPIV